MRLVWLVVSSSDRGRGGGKEAGGDVNHNNTTDGDTLGQHNTAGDTLGQHIHSQDIALSTNTSVSINELHTTVKRKLIIFIWEKFRVNQQETRLLPLPNYR